MSTDKDYADLVDPFVRAEVEAFKRGYGQGILTGIWYAILVGIVTAMLIYATNAHAADWWMSETWAPIKASDCGGKISACHNNAIEGKWTCYCVS